MNIRFYHNSLLFLWVATLNSGAIRSCVHTSGYGWEHMAGIIAASSSGALGEIWWRLTSQRSCIHLLLLRLCPGELRRQTPDPLYTNMLYLRLWNNVGWKERHLGNQMSLVRGRVKLLFQKWRESKKKKEKREMKKKGSTQRLLPVKGVREQHSLEALSS